MMPAERCRAVAEACCQLLAPDQPWRVVVTATERNVIIEICASGDTYGVLVGRLGKHAEAIRVLVTAAGLLGGARVGLKCWVYNAEGGR